MFKVGKEFHLLHVVSDLDTVDGWYDEVFAVRRFVRNSMKAAMRKASLVLIDDFVMEAAQPLRRTPGWQKSALGKFYTRYGRHFHSIAWYVIKSEPASSATLDPRTVDARLRASSPWS